MKAYVVFLLFALVHLSWERDLAFDDVATRFVKIVDDSQQDCMETSGANAEVVKGALQNGVFPDDRTLMCFINCIHLNLGLMDTEDNVDEDILKKYVGIGIDDDAVLDAVFNKCKGAVGVDGCETSHAISKCVYATVHELTKAP